MVTSCITVVQHQNQETDTGTIHRAYFTSFIALTVYVSVYVCLVLENLTYV